MKINMYFSSVELSAAAYRDLLPDFFTEIISDFKLLEKSGTVKNFKEVRRLAHKLKGCAASYSAIDIFAKAKVLQEHLDVNNYNACETAIAELGRSLDVSFQFAKEEFKF